MFLLLSLLTDKSIKKSRISDKTLFGVKRDERQT
jgi:hypothetical protein